MSVRRDSPAPRPAPPPPELEDEVDLGRYWASVAARWWLPLVGLVLGAVVGGILPSVQTNATAVRQIVAAASTRQRVARDVGLKPGQLTASATPVGVGTAAKGVQNTLFTITVKAPSP